MSSDDSAVQQSQQRNAAFAVLGVSGDTATMAEVRKAYRQRALAVHPDRVHRSSTTTGTHVTFVELHRAYEVAQAAVNQRDAALHVATCAAEEAAVAMSALEKKWDAAAEAARATVAEKWTKMHGGRRAAPIPAAEGRRTLIPTLSAPTRPVLTSRAAAAGATAATRRQVPVAAKAPSSTLGPSAASKPPTTTTTRPLPTAATVKR